MINYTIKDIILTKDKLKEEGVKEGDIIYGANSLAMVLAKAREGLERSIFKAISYKANTSLFLNEKMPFLYNFKAQEIASGKEKRWEYIIVEKESK